MPHIKLNLNDAAKYLHIPSQDLQYLVDRGKIPFIKEKGKIFLRRSDLNDWAVKHIFNRSHPKEKIGKAHYSANTIWSNIDDHPKRISDYVYFDGIDPNLNARTKPSVLRELVKLAGKTNLLLDSNQLLRSLTEREELMPTGLTNGVAIPHPKNHSSSLFTESFLVIAKVYSAIPFGAMDNENSDIFFMPCASNEDEHIFILSRLAAMIKNTGIIDDIRKADTKKQIIESIEQSELLILKK